MTDTQATPEVLQARIDQLQQRVAELEQAAEEHAAEEQANEQTLAHWQQLNEQLQRQIAELRVFYAMAENAPDTIISTDLENNITYANTAFHTLFGYGNEVIGMHSYDMYAESPKKLHGVTEQVIEQGSWRGVLSYRRKDGTTFPGALSIFRIADRSGKPTAIGRIIRDITDQMLHEQQMLTLQEEVIQSQRDALRELSTPLMPLSDGVLAMPLVGTIDTNRAQQIMETLLEGVAHHQAHIAILDITGVQTIDTQVANALVNAARAVRLLGAQVVLTGIGPPMAQTLVHLGADLGSIVSRGTLQAGIAYAMEHAVSRRTT